MIFTSRTYRHAIRRSVAKERELRHRKNRAKPPLLRCFYLNSYYIQINHTRRLQARKRKERK